MYNYGTAGFRYNEDKLKEISYKIGLAVSYLIVKKGENYGIMITGSHNIYSDNGVKIVNTNGEMLNKEEEEIIEQLVNNNSYDNALQIDEKLDLRCYIGMDTRRSCNDIKELIKSAIKKNQYIKIIDLNYVTTPQHHYLTSIKSENNEDYIEFYNILWNLKLNQQINVDCANGIGSITLEKIKDKYNLTNINIINNNISDVIALNNGCGSDYVCNNKLIPTGEKCENILYSSFDGDADRVVFYYEKEGKFNLLDGDYISALYLKCILEELTADITIGVIHTAYTNSGYLDYIKNLNRDNVSIVCAATGVKNLHHEALKFDIGIYFESNGHGTILINNNQITTNYLDIIKQLNNKVVGDAISGLLCILYSLHYLNISKEEWYNFFKKKPSLLLKKEVNDKDIYITTKDQKKLINPKIIQDKLDDIMAKDNCFIFIRASGTEDIVRVYIEGDRMNDVKDEVLEQLY
jgi:phosphoacetylglucosamine mutase